MSPELFIKFGREDSSFLSNPWLKVLLDIWWKYQRKCRVVELGILLKSILGLFIPSNGSDKTFQSQLQRPFLQLLICWQKNFWSICIQIFSGLIKNSESPIDLLYWSCRLGILCPLQAICHYQFIQIIDSEKWSCVAMLNNIYFNNPREVQLMSLILLDPFWKSPSKKIAIFWCRVNCLDSLTFNTLIVLSDFSYYQSLFIEWWSSHIVYLYLVQFVSSILEVLSICTDLMADQLW